MKRELITILMIGALSAGMTVAARNAERPRTAKEWLKLVTQASLLLILAYFNVWAIRKSLAFASGVGDPVKTLIYYGYWLGAGLGFVGALIMVLTQQDSAVLIPQKEITLNEGDPIECPECRRWVSANTICYQGRHRVRW